MEKTLQQKVKQIHEELMNKAVIVCRNYCKYYEQCYEERDRDYKEDNIWDECPLSEIFW